MNHELRIMEKTQNKSNLKSKIQNQKFLGKSRYFLKIQDGCEQFCSYCIIPYTRGKLWSKPENEVIDEVECAINDGYQEIVLCGIHLGLYGQEVKSRKLKVKSDLKALLKKIIKINKLFRVRLSSIEITEVSDDLIKLMAGSDKICKHLHIPLQSGSDRILKLMKRPYSTKYYENKIKKIRKLMPDIAITTDVMVGFPGETAVEFKKTYGFIKKMKFSRLHVFPFSAHEKTPAAKLPGRVGEIEKIKCAKILRKLGVGLANDYKDKFKDKILDVLVEKSNGKKFIGKSQYYFDAEFTKNKIIDKLEYNRKLIGKIIKVKNLI